MARKQKFSDDEIRNAVAQSYSYRSTLILLGLCGDGGGNVGVLKERIKQLKICTKHFHGCAHLKNKNHNWNKKTPSCEIFVENSTYKGSTHAIKKRFIKEYNISYECEICKISKWLDKKISLQLDHKNGKRNDNRKENLRLLCPNCHSLTDTFAGKNKYRQGSPTAGGN